MKTEIFPLDIATGAAFCNRFQERSLLKRNIEHNTHTILYAPRRFGKTSLAYKVCEEMERSTPKMIYINIDLMWISSIDDVIKVLLKEVSKALSNILPKYEQALSLLKEMAKNIEASIKLSGADSTVSLDLKAREVTPDTIIELLETLNAVAKRKKHKIVFFLDEFQQIAEVKSQNSIEAAFRSAAQKSTNVTYFFSGSNRHMLSLMFEDKARPLYHMCDQVTVERISEKDYQEHISNAAKMNWKKTLDSEVIHLILILTARHPYYVNALCRKLFQLTKVPTESIVKDTWHHYVNREEKRFMTEFGRLSSIQKKLLQGLCLYPTNKPASGEFLNKAGINSGSLNKSLDRLYALDIIYKRGDGIIEPIDPVILYGIKQANE